ncbi:MULTISPECIES: class I SAM-dependent methyltransferase [Moorena]|uniref:Methylase involved in ubiquinone/menaquinone biosynthesis n=1 Tax=Moorena producens 3L TaxID=489825 RepID=F4Y035_9CYAN|nr:MULTISPECIES: class I SAM-dependent methyltransferase [Moorena]EGJ29767.1 methylase involved in ubiquinone/menaquinone biosynthesis [Moorena producens 3L]NEP34617.1 class I SAM-dependent methyltransferase [Moorena sp. SIO3B2]NEP65694.1 class I SAM-dependent methyltransferase [Moorena sp. SIO3A5]NER85924.1 class I SAM-dependent methyltransferase [Moorena sp. SIO3A2]NES43281.1 class I SAM-dependent methyltransferase [Moorena sp. SIO2C4]
MAVNQDTLWERFLSPIIFSLIDQEKLLQFNETMDWEAECDRFRNPELIYPDYYSTQNFHGIEGGYLNGSAATSYDPITQYALPPNETWVRQGLIDSIVGKPRRILDLGCGTGSTTLMLKQRFPDAQVIGLDLSPYMLVMADYKANKANVDIQWLHGMAEQTGLADQSFDLVTASLLFHETPPQVTQSILHESFRLLQGGGQVLILDGNQTTIREANWLTEVFEEPYIKAYANGSVDAWMGAASFEAVRTTQWWWLHQITQGLKPLPVGKSAVWESQSQESFPDEIASQGVPVPAV